ncbi:MBL fold metallo-hydrolase [Winogradskyella sp.]|uniref:ComEC/Rec2 family competence protein n=1 Tax=Winogradskyella sp. TaxID=1883156 RepID=UPI00260A6AF8|nr:MBL fold metallo-hydrolase [Winogradskyella sp.]
MISIKFLKAINGDCILISFKDLQGKTKNILIDGGLDATYYESKSNSYGELKTSIDYLRKKNQKINLLVLSHIDNDHINGLLKWFEMDNKAHELIEKVWFNSGKLIAEWLKEPENPDLKVGLKIFEDPYTGVPEALRFEEYLLKSNIWERKIIMQGATLEDDETKIQVLSPSKKQLIRLLKEYKKKTGDDSYTSGRKKDWPLDLKSFIVEEDKNYTFSQDSSPKNGSSITLLITYNEKNFLFLADSHPKQIVKSLKRMGYSKQNPIELELLQVSHHGSKANNNVELFEITKTNNYVISTNSSSHNHPHKRTLARIIKVNPKATFHFNYEFVLDNIFTENDFEEFKEFKAKTISTYTIS